MGIIWQVGLQEGKALAGSGDKESTGRQSSWILEHQATPSPAHPSPTCSSQWPLCAQAETALQSAPGAETVCCKGRRSTQGSSSTPRHRPFIPVELFPAWANIHHHHTTTSTALKKTRFLLAAASKII